LARSIVEAHGGKLRIESSPRGATVSFALRGFTNDEGAA
jgi:signal transduction histidine kinase